MDKISDINGLRVFVWEYENLKKIVKSLRHLDECACNYGLTPRQEKREENLEKKAAEIAARFGLNAYHQSDPRGCTLYLVDGYCKDYTDGIAILV